MDLSQARSSTNDGPTRVGMHSVEGFGKTTFLAHWESPLIVGAERGIPRDLGFSVDTIQPNVWGDLFDIIGDLRRKRHPYKTLGFDTMDWIEPLIYKFCCDRDSKRQTEMNPKGRLLESIEDYGYGKGYLVAEEEFRKLLVELDILQAERGMHVVMLMHSHTKTFKNPSGPDFDRWEPKCQSRIARVVVEYVEHMLFGFFQVDAAKISEDKERHKMSPDRARAKGISTGVRMIGAQNGALYDAKNRVGLPAEFEYTQPSELINMLLGEHLAPELRAHERKPQSYGEMRDSTAVAERAANERVADNFAKDAARDFETPPQDPRDKRNPNGGGTYREAPTNEPAMHESRQADERERRDEAMERTRQGNKVIEESRQKPNGKDQQKLEDAPNGKSKKVSPIDMARHKALEVRGDKYLAKIDGWITKAAGDNAKLQSIINQIDKDCEQTQQQR